MVNRKGHRSSCRCVWWESCTYRLQVPRICWAAGKCRAEGTFIMKPGTLNEWQFHQHWVRSAEYVWTSSTEHKDKFAQLYRCMGAFGKGDVLPIPKTEVFEIITEKVTGSRIMAKISHAWIWVKKYPSWKTWPVWKGLRYGHWLLERGGGHQPESLTTGI